MVAVEHFSQFLMDGMGGLSASGASLAADQLNLPDWYRPVFYRHLGTFISQLRKVKNNGR